MRRRRRCIAGRDGPGAASIVPRPAAHGVRADRSPAPARRGCRSRSTSGVPTRRGSGLTINYQGVGSTAGRQFYIIGQVDFAASEIPFLPDEVAQLQPIGHSSYQYLPDVAGGTAVMYNLKDATGAPGDQPAAVGGHDRARSSPGKITVLERPGDPQADNPRLALPATRAITPVIRSDGSGTSAKLADYSGAPGAVDLGAVRGTVRRSACRVQFWPNIPRAVAAARLGRRGQLRLERRRGLGCDRLRRGRLRPAAELPRSRHPEQRQRSLRCPTSTNVAVGAQARHAEPRPDPEPAGASTTRPRPTPTRWRATAT